MPVEPLCNWCILSSMFCECCLLRASMSQACWAARVALYYKPSSTPFTVHFHKTLATDNSSENWKHFCLGGNWPRRIVTVLFSVCVRNTLTYLLTCWRRGVIVNSVGTNEVNQHRARLVLGWVTVFGRVSHLRYVTSKLGRLAFHSCGVSKMEKWGTSSAEKAKAWFIPFEDKQRR